MDFEETIELVGKTVDGAGVLVIVAGMLLATVRLVRSPARAGATTRYRAYRQDVGRAILLGLEILVAADIIRTVAVEPTIESVGVLGVIVVIRTVLSFSLEVELEGRWPWQSPADASDHSTEASRAREVGRTTEVTGSSDSPTRSSD